MQQRIRTFIAVEADPSIRKSAAALIDRLRQSAADVKWVAPENLHLTVKFLGDVNADDVAAVCEAVERSVAEVSPFELDFGGAGAFPNLRRPQTIWLGVREGNERMANLADRVERALKRFGFRRETRQFRSHLTLGRMRRDGGGPGGRELAELLAQFADYEAGRMPVEEIVVFSSQLERTGPIYEAMRRAPLGGT
jgi:2'-5' RNA ligase